MAIRTVVRAAVAFSAASALSMSESVYGQHVQEMEARWNMGTDLPRALLVSKDQAASGCGKDYPGYFTIDGLMWMGTWKSAKSWETTGCARHCDENRHCIGFSTRQPRHGKLQCWMYKGLIPQQDHLAKAYMRCIKGFECQDGFQFSHNGTWRAGKRIPHLDDEDMEECRLACRKDRGCVGFTFRVNHQEDKFCYHFEDADNRQGPSRDSRAITYSKCAQLLEDGSVLRTAATNETEAEDDQSGAPASNETEDEGSGAAPAPGGEQGEDPAPAADAQGAASAPEDDDQL